MKVEVTARHFEAPMELKEFVEKKIHRLDRYFNGVLDCRVILSNNISEQVAEIIAHSKKHQFTAVESSAKMDRAVMKAIRKMKTQLRRHKAKLRDK